MAPRFIRIQTHRYNVEGWFCILAAEGINQAAKRAFIKRSAREREGW